MRSTARRLAELLPRIARHVGARLSPKERPTILMYHRVADESFNPWGTIVSPRRFEAHLAWIAKHRRPLPLAQFAELHRKGALPKGAIAVTFDDGYEDNAEIAAPLLRQFDIPATIFLPVEWMEKGEPFWWDEVPRIVFGHEGSSLRLGARHFPLGPKSPGDRRWSHSAPPSTPRQIVFLEIWSELLERDPTALEHGVAELREQFQGNTEGSPLPRPMTPEQIRRLRGNGIDFGSHTLTHPDLTKLGLEDRRSQIFDSIGRCEALTGSRPTSFAYPYGLFDEQCEAMVVEAGFTCACSTERAAVGPASRSHALPRMHVGNWAARKIAVQLGLL